MSYKYFYADYCEGKEIDASDPWDAELSQIVHSMDCVLHMPENFLGIVNEADQTLQFVVEEDRTVTIDIPILEDGIYVGSKQKNTNLS